MSQLTSFLQYLFEPVPGNEFGSMYLYIIITVLGIAASFGVRYYISMQKEDKILKKFFKRLPAKLLTASILLGLYIVARVEKLMYFSMRAVLYAILIYGIYIIARAVITYVRSYPEHRQAHLEKVEANKYLPRKKKK